MMDKEMALVFYRALLMIVRYLEKRYNFGTKDPPPQYEIERQHEKQNVVE
jgi:hypothetical protein